MAAEAVQYALICYGINGVGHEKLLQCPGYCDCMSCSQSVDPPFDTIIGANSLE